MARKKKTLTNFTPSRAKHLISLAKVIGPAVVPVVAPYALKAAGVARNSYEHLRARQLGVDVDVDEARRDHQAAGIDDASG